MREETFQTLHDNIILQIGKMYRIALKFDSLEDYEIDIRDEIYVNTVRLLQLLELIKEGE